jgi:hypothetical protein
MKKIPTLFVRDPANPRLVTRQVTPGCEGVIDGQGTPTRKWDGTACLVRDGILFKRYDAKRGKVPPANFEPAQPEPDPITGHWPGWVPVGDEPDSRYHREAFALVDRLVDGTYELIGPRVQGNPERQAQHHLVAHGDLEVAAPRTFDELRRWLEHQAIEGVVWWSVGGFPLAKIKRRDFGYPWPVPIEPGKDR